MSDISNMTDKQLRNEVQLLRDELAIMKRKYEDIIYNLDTDNFSSRFVKEQGDMKTAIKVTAILKLKTISLHCFIRLTALQMLKKRAWAHRLSERFCVSYSIFLRS